MKVSELIDKLFGDKEIIWFDFTDYVKVNYSIRQKGLSYFKKYGRYEIYFVSEDSDFTLIDVLTEEDVDKFNNILTVFRQ